MLLLIKRWGLVKKRASSAPPPCGGLFKKVEGQKKLIGLRIFSEEVSFKERTYFPPLPKPTGAIYILNRINVCKCGLQGALEAVKEARSK